MDHLDIPYGAEPLLVPYRCTEDYDGGDFFDYPKRQGWSETDGVIDFSDHAYSSEHVEAFLQNWLYFGCVFSILKLVGIQASTSDFIWTPEGQKVVSTKSLAGFLVDWEKKDNFKRQLKLYEGKHGSLEYIWPGEKHRRLGGRYGRGKEIGAILNKVDEYVRRYCINVVTDPDLYPQSPISMETGLSILVLLMKLRQITTDLYPTEREDNKTSTKSIRSRWVTERMMKAGWCPLELELLLSECDLAAQYYFAFLPSPRWGMDHSACDKNTCCRKRINSIGYSTKHRKGCKKCEMVTVSDEMSLIVSKDKTPLISWRKREGSEDFELEIVEYDPTSEENYVAISHVWSDGMGNEKSNSLPQCQLSNIQKLVDQLYMRKRHENHDISVIGPTNYFILEPSVSKKKRSTSGSPRPPTRFWMDTLCVPVDNYDLRKKAIGRMRTIYTEAHRTLVLDSWIRSLSRKASQNERGACLFLSNWQSRLWTFNEGLLARNLFFQFKDGPGSHSEMKREAVQESRESDGKVVHNIGRHLLQQIPMFDLQVASPEIKAMIKTNYRLLLYTIPLRLRSTTNKSDETLCLATLLDFNPEPLLLIKKIPKELRTDWTFEQEEAEEERVCKEGMALFLQMVGDLGPSIIFNTLPRLPLRGFQWAPRTFLGHKTHGSGIYEGAEHLWLDTHHLSGGKILGPGGILVTAPGAQLEVLENHNSTGAISALMVSLEETDSTGLCVITPGIGEPAEFPLWQIGARYGILCEAPIDSGEEIKAAILVMIDDCETKVEVEGDWMRVLHICRIKLHFADAVEILDSGDGSAISAKFLNKVKKRNWCVM